MVVEFDERHVQDAARSLRLNILRRTYLREPPKKSIEVRIDAQHVGRAQLAPTPGADAAKTGEMAVREPPGAAQHPHWQLGRVITGHRGWVQCVCVDPENDWFATGSADQTIKVWDLASGQLRVTLTGHVLGVRALAVSDRGPYLFSGGQDNAVKCWDLEYNKVVRDYHGHLNGVYTLALHPTLDVLVTGGRDSAVRVWDIRTREAVHVLTGHTSTVNAVKCQDIDPQIISGSQDTTIRLWDIAAGKSLATLTHHSKSVRALAVSHEELTFASASRDAIKKWKLPEGHFMGDSAPNSEPIVNTLSLDDGVLFAGGDDGSMQFYDYATAQRYQVERTLPYPGSLSSEAAILASSFDQTGLRLITCESDKSIKIWKAS